MDRGPLHLRRPRSYVLESPFDCGPGARARWRKRSSDSVPHLKARRLCLPLCRDSTITAGFRPRAHIDRPARESLWFGFGGFGQCAEKRAKLALGEDDAPVIRQSPRRARAETFAVAAGSVLGFEFGVIGRLIRDYSTPSSPPEQYLRKADGRAIRTDEKRVDPPHSRDRLVLSCSKDCENAPQVSYETWSQFCFVTGAQFTILFDRRGRLSFMDRNADGRRLLSTPPQLSS